MEWSGLSLLSFVRLPHLGQTFLSLLVGLLERESVIGLAHLLEDLHLQFLHDRRLLPLLLLLQFFLFLLDSLFDLKALLIDPCEEWCQVLVVPLVCGLLQLFLVGLVDDILVDGLAVLVLPVLLC